MNSHRLRILVLASTFPRWRGDTEPPFVYTLSDGLTEEFDVTVLAPHGPGCKTDETWGELRILRFRYFWPERFEKLAYGGILPNLSRNKLLWLLVPCFFIGEFVAAMRIVRSEKIDVLHAHWVIPQGLTAIIVGWLTNTPVVTTCHAADMYALRGRFRNMLKRWVLNRCQYFTAVNHQLVEEARALGVRMQTPSSVISMGVDTSLFNPCRRDEALRQTLNASGPIILSVGRLAEKKGLKYLLDAMPDILQDFPDATLAIVGDGDQRQRLEAQARVLKIQDNVCFLGAMPQSELPAYYATADVFVGPSITVASGDREGLPVAFIEALASGCPVVCSDVGGANEIVAHERTGLLLPEQDANAIARGVIKLLADGALRQKLGTEGLNWVNGRFDQKTVARKYAQVIIKVATQT